ITTDCYVDIPRIIRQTVREVGYTRAKYGFDAETCGVVTSIDEQSPDIAQGVDVGGAGDSGMMFGFACDDTPELMPMPITLAHRLARKLAEVRRNKTLNYLRPDGKVQVTIRYGDDGKPAGVDNVVLSTQHHDEVEAEQLRADIAEHVIDPVLPAELRDGSVRTFVNPTGRFVIGGPVSEGCRCHHRRGGGEAFRLAPPRDHQSADPAPPALSADRGLRPLWADGHRRAVGVDRARQGARRRGQVTSPRTVAVIPAGGAGTRLWPRSRASTPKHVLPLGDHGRPLLRTTYDRARSVADEVFVLTEV